LIENVGEMTLPLLLVSLLKIILKRRILLMIFINLFTLRSLQAGLKKNDIGWRMKLKYDP
jgi:hypothetical protein